MRGYCFGLVDHNTLVLKQRPNQGGWIVCLLVLFPQTHIPSRLQSFFFFKQIQWIAPCPHTHTHVAFHSFVISFFYSLTQTLTATLNKWPNLFSLKKHCHWKKRNWENQPISLLWRDALTVLVTSVFQSTKLPHLLIQNNAQRKVILKVKLVFM